MEGDPPMSHSRAKTIGTALATAIVAIEYLGIAWYATANLLHGLSAPDLSSLTYLVIACGLYLAMALNIAPAYWFFLRMKRTGRDVRPRLLIALLLGSTGLYILIECSLDDGTQS
jgi:divalent metal cation (Fe/Co/Zn/Cd) transporter